MGNLISSVITRLFGGKEATIVMIGLDGSGKTTTLYRIKDDDIVTTIPTLAWDLGGECKIRDLWKHYYDRADGLLIVIDSNDKDRLEELKEFLKEHLSRHELRKDTKVLFFANKQDLPNAISTKELVKQLELNKIVPFEWFITPCSAYSGEGLIEGFDWLAKKL